jgi:hypothetical protein
VNASPDVAHDPIVDACSSPSQLPHREMLRRPLERKLNASIRVMDEPLDARPLVDRHPERFQAEI